MLIWIFLIQEISSFIATPLESVMHQSIPAAPDPPPPPPPPGYCGAFALLFSPGGGEFANFVPPRGRAFANHGAIPELLTRTRFPFRIQLHRGYYWKKSTLAHLLRTGGCEACSRFYACISSLPIKPELHSETRELGITKHNRSRSSASSWSIAKPWRLGMGTQRRPNSKWVV